MNLYFDTSALVKFFHIEKGTDKVTELILDVNNQISISERARIEFYSAIYKQFRNNNIDESDLQQAREGFKSQLKNFRVERLGSAVVQKAEALFMEFGDQYFLRTLDALQIATFQLVAESDWSFVSTDNRLNDLADRLNYKVINPI